ncbi:MAG: calcium/sodium antiporter [Eubacterium sp.]|nr:calcium/sodium antiporter [Eubacterium sp.]
MDIIINIVILVIAFVALVKGADMFVDGAASIAKHFNVSSLIIGLTVVAMGTSFPELSVSASAALSGSNEIAISNVLGSNICNLLLVLGTCAMISPLTVDRNILKRDFPFMIFATIAMFAAILIPCISDFIALSSKDMEAYVGVISRFMGVALLAIFVCYILFLIRESRKSTNAELSEEIPEMISLPKSFLFIIVGIVLIIGGGQGVVYAARNIASSFGMSETLIGLTVVAIGTSLPELVTSVVAAHKNEAGLAIGNAVGSNIFNLLLILGVSSAINPISVNVASIYDMAILIFVSVITMVFCSRKKDLNRGEGFVMVLMYAAEIVFSIVR